VTDQLRGDEHTENGDPAGRECPDPAAAGRDGDDRERREPTDHREPSGVFGRERPEKRRPDPGGRERQRRGVHVVESGRRAESRQHHSTHPADRRQSTGVDADGRRVAERVEPAGAGGACRPTRSVEEDTPPDDREEQHDHGSAPGSSERPTHRTPEARPRDQ